MAQRRRPAGQKAFDVLHGTAAAADARRDERRQAATAAEMQVGLRCAARALVMSGSLQNAFSIG